MTVYIYFTKLRGLGHEGFSLKTSQTLEPRRLPIQKRAVARTRLIFDTTAKLLEEVGIEDLTTILIAKNMGISVGSLYHYFPNKHAILHGLGAQWLDEMTQALEDLEQLDYQSLSLTEFVEQSIDRILLVYQNQRAVLPLMEAISSIPELRSLDEEHDEMVITKYIAMFKRLGLTGSRSEFSRVAWIYLEMTHAMFLLVMDQKKSDAKKTVNDVKRMSMELLKPLA